jgi:hypothetical protein
MPNVRTAAVLIFAALVTAGTAAAGLIRANRLWTERIARPACPVPEPRVESTPGPAPTTGEAPKRDLRIGVLSVREDAIEIEAGGERHVLPGYPPPRSADHKWARLTTAVVAPDGRRVAIAGVCYGQSGMGGQDGTPSCAPTFVRVYQVADGSHLRDLNVRWVDDDVIETLALTFDQRAERLAVVVRRTWSDCMSEDQAIELYVYRLADGARLAHSVLADDPAATRSLTFHEGEVHVLTGHAHARPKVRVVRLRKPPAA